MASLAASIDITSPFDALIPNQAVTVMLEVVNSGGSTVTVTDIQPVITPIDGGASTGRTMPAGPGAVTIAAGAVRYFPFSIVFFAPQTGQNQPASYSFTLGTIVYTSDGAVTLSPNETLKVFKASHATVVLPAAGGFDFSSPLDSSNIIFLW